MKEAILINLVNPSAGGVLIRGQKGTAKTTAVRAIPGLMKDCRVVEILPMPQKTVWQEPSTSKPH